MHGRRWRRAKVVRGKRWEDHDDEGDSLPREALHGLSEGLHCVLVDDLIGGSRVGQELGPDLLAASDADDLCPDDLLTIARDQP